MFKDIVLAITPSQVCERAADKAIAFAQRFEAKLYLVHVAGAEQGWGSMKTLQASGETERIKANIQDYYSEKLKGLSDYKIDVTPGIAHNEILRLARKYNSDLIVMGPHTKEYAERRAKMWGMTGSTLERVSQKARCPVMIVTRESPYGEQTFNSILVATDFSSQSDCAINYGGQLARQYKSKLTVLHVVEAGALPQEIVEARIRDERLRMEAEYGDRLLGVPEHELEVWEGSPAVEILKMARMKKADLIIMAHHSREMDPEKAFMGSTMVQVALNSACPTMSVNRHFDLRCGMMYDQHGEVTEEKAKAEA